MSVPRPGDRDAAEAPGTPDPPVPGFAYLLSLAMAQFMVVLDFTIVNVALPSIQAELHVATTTLQWLVSAYAVAFGGFLLLGGRLADAYAPAASPVPPSRWRNPLTATGTGTLGP